MASCVNAYINVGSVYILKKQWQHAVWMFNTAEALLTKSALLNNAVEQRIEALVMQCNAQAFMGLYGMDRAELVEMDDNSDDRLREHIMKRLTRVLELDAPKEQKAAAHRSLAYFYEKICELPNMEAMILHRKAAFEHLDLMPQSLCPICSDDINMEDLGLATLGCFHMFHRACYRKWETHRAKAGTSPECPVCRFSGHS